MAIWLGVDPGASGALCLLEQVDNDPVTVEFCDFKTDSIRGYLSFIKDEFLLTSPVKMVGLEKVSAMPGQGVKSMFSFGQRLGE
jgi:hypothetical protein